MRAFTFFLDWELNCQFAGPVWAREKGLYRQAGLAVQLSPPSDNPESRLIDLVLDHDNVAGSIEENLILRAATAGKPVRAVAVMLRETPLVLMTARHGPVRALSDLPGRRVAMHGDGVQLLEALLALNGNDPESVICDVGDWSLDDLLEGRFDAVQGYAITEAWTLAKQGFDARLIPLCHPDLDPHSQVIFASAQSIAERAGDLRAFLQATFEGWREALDRPEEAAKLVAGHSKEHADPTENRAILGGIRRFVYGRDAVEPLGSLDPQRWQRNLASYAQFGLSGRAADLDQVIEPSLYAGPSTR